MLPKFKTRRANSASSATEGINYQYYFSANVLISIHVTLCYITAILGVKTHNSSALKHLSEWGDYALKITRRSLPVKDSFSFTSRTSCFFIDNSRLKCFIRLGHLLWNQWRAYGTIRGAVDVENHPRYHDSVSNDRKILQGKRGTPVF